MKSIHEIINCYVGESLSKKRKEYYGNFLKYENGVFVRGQAIYDFGRFIEINGKHHANTPGELAEQIYLAILENNEIKRREKVLDLNVRLLNDPKISGEPAAEISYSDLWIYKELSNTELITTIRCLERLIKPHKKDD